MDQPLSDTELFFNRELSWLEFNQRVLDQAKDPSNPLLERLKFLSIVSSNLDEFFEVRVAGLKQQRQTGVFESEPDGLTAGEALDKISTRVRRMVEDQYTVWRNELCPALEAEDIKFFGISDLPDSEREALAQYYHDSVHPVLTPLAIDPAHPFPQLLNKSLNVMVELEGEGLEADTAVVQVPRILPRVVPLAGNNHHFVFLGHLIQEHVASLFRGVQVKGAHLFRITRNSNLYFDEEEAQNLLHAIESELQRVNRGAAVRLEVEQRCPQPVVDRIIEIFNLEPEDAFAIDGPLNLVRLMPLAIQIDRPDLRFKPFTPNTVIKLEGDSDIFFHIRKGDILLHHPYDRFQTVLDFLAQAAEDPNVLAIKQTLYRTSSDSPLVSSLIEAARNGKQVTVVIELKARFDEAANIKWARVMREAGIDVVYGVTGLKTHSKMMLVIRNEGESIRRYAHLGTGNYHPSTAKLYTDIGVLTCRKEVTDEIAETFNCLTGVSRFPVMKELLVAPFNLFEETVELIRNEADNARAGKPSGIFAKVNSLIEERIIRELYKASQAGVPIKLLVRGMCALRPGLPGVSESIEVRSIVGRFLEHSRIFRYENAGEAKMYLGSADWMPRNIFRRVETVFPIISEGMRGHVDEIISWLWQDNTKARAMQPDGSYLPVQTASGSFDSQQAFIDDAEARRKARITRSSDSD